MAGFSNANFEMHSLRLQDAFCRIRSGIRMKMKTTIYVTKEVIFALVLFAVGGYCTLYGAKSLYREKTNVLLEMLSAEQCQRKIYVAGTMERPVTITVGRQTVGESRSFLTLTGDCHFYTLPLADGRFITVMLKRKETVAAMERLVKGGGPGVPLEGQIVKELIEPNYEWLAQSAQIKDPKKDVVAGIAIMEISFSERRKFLYVGALTLLLAVWYVWQRGLLRETVDHISQSNTPL